MLPLILLLACSANGALFYDSYRGVPISREEVKRHDKSNTTFWCVNEIEPCDPTEGRRVDGSCNNLQNPQRGASHTPFARVLPPNYSANFEPKKTKSGNEMPLARYLRTRLVSVGRVPSKIFSMLAIHYFVFMSADGVSLHDTVNYIAWKPYCCLPRGKNDSMCAPNMIPNDDPVHRFSNIRCFNMTKPETFQSIGCVKNNTTPERIVSSTPLMDLSIIYGNFLRPLVQNGRLFEGGLVKTELDEQGRIWPPSTKAKINVCLLNEKPRETRCHAMPEDGGNTLAGINMLSIWFWRYHNVIVKELARVNPCWSDEKLFNTGRDINIAVALQIFYYELMPILLGYDNLVKDGVITPTGGYRDIYDEKVLPQLSLEYPFVLRWVHTLQDGEMKMYDKDGYFLRTVPIANLTLRTGFFGVDDNLDHATQGTFRQGSANVDYIADPDITEVGMGPHQHALDLMTNDLAKNRYFGFQPYVYYREFCFGKKPRSFDDLRRYIDPERLEILRDVYENVEDIDLLAAIWVEKTIRGGFVPPTFYCLVIEQMLRNIISDRHWYERPNRPNAFSLGQLSEIRKVTIAGLLCEVGDTVTEIQPHAFLRAGFANRMVPCEHIPKIEFSAWKDGSCEPYPNWSEYSV